MSSSPGSKWMSEDPRSTASLITRCTSWMTDASSPEAPKLIGASRRSYSGPAGADGGSGAAASSSESSSSGAVAPLPKAAGSSRSCRFEESRLAGPVHHVNDQASGIQFIGGQGECLERGVGVVEADGCAVDHDVGRLRSLDRARSEPGGEL